MTQAEIEKIVLQHSNWINGVILNSKRTSELEELTTLNSEDEVGLIQKQSEDAKKIKIPLLRGFVGSWNPTTNIPNLSSGNGLILDTYKVSQNGSRDLGSGTIDFNEGDLITYDGSYWIKLTQSSISDIDGLADELNFKADTRTENTFSQNQYFERAFSNNEATANNELVRLDQLNSAVSGLNWQDPIEDILDFTTSEPTSPTIGDRYINSANGTSSATGQSVTKDNIYEWDGTDWAEFVPVDGWTVFDRAVDQNFTFNGTSWVEFGSTVSHNNTTGLQGGQAGQYFHLSQSQFNAITNDILNIAYRNINNNFSSKQNFQNDVEINGLVSASNLSGTNTGNETKSSIDALGIDAITLQGENGAYYLDYNNLNNKPSTDNYGYFQLQTNSTNRKQIASQNILNFINGAGISISYGSNGAVTISNSITNNNQLTNGAGYVTSSGNTIIGTDSDINTSGAQVIDTLVMTDGVITSHSLRTLTLANLGFTGDSNANRITNNNQLTNGAGYVTSSGNTIIGTDDDISNTGAKVIATLVMTDGVITSHTVRTLTLANLGFTGDTDANKITNNNQITNGAGYITSAGNTQLTKEQVEDFVGGMVTGNVETNISVTYNDTTGKLNFVSVNTQLSNAQVTAITNPLYLGKTAKAVDSDKLDGENGSYYLDYNNFSNTPNLGVYAKLSGGNTFSGTQTFTSTISMKYGSGIMGSGSGASNLSYLEFNESNGTTRQGYIGFGSASDSDLYLKNDVSGKNLRLRDDGVLDYNGNANFSGIVNVDSIDSKIGFNVSDTFGDSIANYGMTSKTRDGLYLSGYFGLKFATSGSERLIIDSNGNAAFSGNVDIEGLLYVNRTINEVARFRNSLNNSSPFFSIYQGNSRKGFFQYNNSADSIRIESDTNNIDFFASGTRQLLLANGNATFSGSVKMGNASSITGSGSGVSNFCYLEFDESNGTTRQGLIGFANSSDSNLYILNNVSNKVLFLRQDGVLDYNGDATFSGDVSANNLTLGGGGGAFTISNESGSYWQRIRTEDSSELSSKIFNFEARLGSGDYTTLFSIENSGNATFSGSVKMGNASGIVGSGSGVSNTSYLNFNESDGTTRQGYVGFGTTSNSNLFIINDISGKALILQSNGELSYGGNATFSGNISANNFIGNWNNKTSTSSSAPSTIVERDTLGDINARLFKSEFSSTNSSIGFIMTQVNTTTNNFIRPSTPEQFRDSVINGFYAKLSGGNEFSGNQIFSGDVEVGGDFTKILLNGTQSGGQQFSISNHIPGVSNIGFSIRNENSGTNVLSINSLNKTTFSGDVEVNGKSNINTGLTGLTYDMVNQANGSISFSNNSGGTAVPTITGKSNNNLGLMLVSGTNDVGYISDMYFDVRENNNTDYTNLNSTAYSFNRYGNALMTILRNGNATFSGDVEVINRSLFIKTNVLDGNANAIVFESPGQDTSKSPTEITSSNNTIYVSCNFEATDKIQASGYKSADGSEGMTTTFNGVIYKNGLAVGTSV